MKLRFTISLICLGAIYASGQPVSTAFVASVSTADRLTLVKTSIPLTEWHQKSFLAQYEDYLNKTQEISSNAYRALEDLALTDKTVSDQDALNNALKLIAYRYEEIGSKHHHFMEIGREHNGVIALQFLQTEAQLDMMESAAIYERTPWRKYRFHSKSLTSTQHKEAKYNTIAKAIGLTPEEATAFYPVYTRYEMECEDLLGTNYTMYELFAGEASDYIPGLAKRLGYDLLTVMKREVELMEKYFNEMNSAVGPGLAARFLAWEDYYAVTSKMYVWAEQ